MAVQDGIREHMPALAALVDIFDALDARTVAAGSSMAQQGAQIAEALKAHEKRGGAVPWK